MDQSTEHTAQAVDIQQIGEGSEADSMEFDRDLERINETEMQKNDESEEEAMQSDWSNTSDYHFSPGDVHADGAVEKNVSQKLSDGLILPDDVPSSLTSGKKTLLEQLPEDGSEDFLTHHHEMLRELDMAKTQMQNPLYARELATMDLEDRRLGIANVMFRLNAFQGLEETSLRAGDRMVIGYLYTILDLFRKRMKTVLRKERDREAGYALIREMDTAQNLAVAAFPDQLAPQPMVQGEKGHLMTSAPTLPYTLDISEEMEETIEDDSAHDSQDCEVDKDTEEAEFIQRFRGITWQRKDSNGDMVSQRVIQKEKGQGYNVVMVKQPALTLGDLSKGLQAPGYIQNEQSRRRNTKRKNPDEEAEPVEIATELDNMRKKHKKPLTAAERQAINPYIEPTSVPESEWWDIGDILSLAKISKGNRPKKGCRIGEDAGYLRHKQAPYAYNYKGHLRSAFIPYRQHRGPDGKPMLSDDEIKRICPSVKAAEKHESWPLAVNARGRLYQRIRASWDQPHDATGKFTSGGPKPQMNQLTQAQALTVAITDGNGHFDPKNVKAEDLGKKRIKAQQETLFVSAANLVKQKEKTFELQAQLGALAYDQVKKEIEPLRTRIEKLEEQLAGARSCLRTATIDSDKKTEEIELAKGRIRTLKQELKTARNTHPPRGADTHKHSNSDAASQTDSVELALEGLKL